MLPSSSERMSLLVRTPTTRMWFPLDWLTSQARSVRGFLSRRAMHASCDSPSHVSAKHRVLAACFCLTAPFRTRFSPHEMARAAHVQKLRGCLYILRYCYIPPCRFARHSFSWNQRRTRSPLAGPAVAVTWSTKRRSRCPSANTRKLLRCLARYHKVWNCVRNALRTEDGMAINFFGSLNLLYAPPLRDVTSWCINRFQSVSRIDMPFCGGEKMTPAWAQRQAELWRDCLVSPDVFQHMVDRLRDFAVSYQQALETETGKRNVYLYLTGLLSHLPRKNAEDIATLVDVERLVLQEFIGTAPWDHRPLLTVLVGEVVERLGEPDGIIAFDPSSFPKRGRHSVGVKRQWCSHRGKVDNCQVGVFMGYVSRHDHALLDFHLSLPEDWARDEQRRAECHVPPEVRYHTRHEQCLEMLDEWGAQVPHGWVTGDDELGRHTRFRGALRARGERYVLGVPY